MCKDFVCLDTMFTFLFHMFYVLICLRVSCCFCANFENSFTICCTLLLKLHSTRLNKARHHYISAHCLGKCSSVSIFKRSFLSFPSGCQWVSGHRPEVSLLLGPAEDERGGGAAPRPLGLRLHQRIPRDGGQPLPRRNWSEACRFTFGSTQWGRQVLSWMALPVVFTVPSQFAAKLGSFSREGLRVLALAYKPLDASTDFKTMER